MKYVRKVEACIRERGFCPFKPSSDFMKELRARKPAERRGIYIHVMPGLDKFYVGKSIDVLERYKQHKETYGQIELTSFLPVPEAELGPVEEEHIAKLRELGVTLLNILLPDEDLGSADIAEILNEKTLEDWVFDPKAVWRGAAKVHEAAKYARFDAKYSKLLSHPRRSDELYDLLNHYVRTCIPRPDRTEGTFWTLNCLTNAFRRHPSRALFRISVHRPEVLTVVDNPKDPKMPPFAIMFTIDSEVMTPAEHRSFRKIPDVTEGYDDVYRSAPFPHHRVSALSVESARALMRHKGFVRSAKACVAQLITQGQVPRNFTQSHCLPLVRDILSRPYQV